MYKLVEDFAKEYAKDLIFDLVRTGALSAKIGAEKLNLSLKDFFDLLDRTEPCTSDTCTGVEA